MCISVCVCVCEGWGGCLPFLDSTTMFSVNHGWDQGKGRVVVLSQPGGLELQLYWTLTGSHTTGILLSTPSNCGDTYKCNKD